MTEKFLCIVRSRSLRRADPSSRGVLLSVWVSLGVIRFNNIPLHLRGAGGRDQTKNDWKVSKIKRLLYEMSNQLNKV
jgi:hypothetical protein